MTLHHLGTSCLLLLLLLGCTPEEKPDPAPKQQDGVPTVRIADDDPGLEAASAEARDSLDSFVARLREGRADTSRFAVKVRKADGEHVECLWVSDLTYTDQEFIGAVINSPSRLRNLKAGDRIGAGHDDIVDWMYVDDGSLVGGFTTRYLLKRMDPEIRERELAKLDYRIP